MFRRPTPTKRTLRRGQDRDSLATQALGLTDPAYAPMATRWIFRGLLPLGAHKEILDEHMIYKDEVVLAVGLKELCDQNDSGKHKHGAAMKRLKKLHAEHEDMKVRVPGKSILERNLKWFGQRLGLSPVERDILRLLVVVKDCSPLKEVLKCIGDLRRTDLVRAISVLLDHPEPRVIECLRPERPLLASGVATLTYDERLPFSRKIQLIDGIAEELFNEHADPLLMIRGQVVAAPAAKLRASDYPHLSAEIELLTQYFQGAAARPGINVLIFGPPGTGKTEFVRALAEARGLSLFEVASKNGDGTPLNSDERLSAYRLAQMLLSSEERTAVLFDEVEDVMPPGEDDFWGRRQRRPSGKKAWFNQMLETNPVPAFWLSNSIDSMDPAMLRRFDFVMPVNAPPRSVRVQIITRYFEGMSVRPTWIERLAEHPELAPAIVERAAKVAAELKLPPEALELAAGRLINGTLEAMAMAPVKLRGSASETRYRAECLNTDPPIDQVARQLARHPHARLCLYGPPGTGKTAYGRYLARAIDRPLIVKRASDLLDCYVGNTEKRIAAMFADAEREKAVLLLDEADSFLQGRGKAVRSWEISQVNEMLTQMEQYDGVFVASTNLIDSLDEATLRRFDLKVKFRWLAPSQIEMLFEDAAVELGIVVDSAWLERAQQLGVLAPGDFANVLRQSRLRPITTSAELYEALQGEVKVRPRIGQAQRIGF